MRRVFKDYISCRQVVFKNYENPVISQINMNINIRNKISFFLKVALGYERAVGT